MYKIGKKGSNGDYILLALFSRELWKLNTFFIRLNIEKNIGIKLQKEKIRKFEEIKENIQASGISLF